MPLFPPRVENSSIGLVFFSVHTCRRVINVKIRASLRMTFDLLCMQLLCPIGPTNVHYFVAIIMTG